MTYTLRLSVKVKNAGAHMDEEEATRFLLMLWVIDSALDRVRELPYVLEVDVA